MFWLILFVSAADGSAGLGAPKLTIGPFQEMKQCYAAAALGVNGLNKDATKDFRASCVADAEILPLQELAKRAGAPP